MRDLDFQIERARRRMDPRWDAPRVESALGGVHAKRRRRAVARTAAVGAALAIALAFPAFSRWWAAGGSTRGATPVAVGAPAEAPRPRGITLRDGSTATPLDDRSDLAKLEDGPSRVTMEVVGGGGLFDVVPNHARLFRVRAGSVTVEVLGTSFTVERRGDEARVEVLRGRVRVLWPEGETTLSLGESGVFPRPSAEATPAPHEPRRVLATKRAWSELAQAGDYAGAYDVLRDAPASAVADEPEALLLAADAARLSGHPADALPYLVRVVRDHASDARAALAAFTRGRVLPGEAAAAFAEARALSVGGSLAPDALAREVEAWHRAGRPDLARAKAEEYVGLYPDGSRLRSVRRFGGLETIETE